MAKAYRDGTRTSCVAEIGLPLIVRSSWEFAFSVTVILCVPGASVGMWYHSPYRRVTFLPSMKRCACPSPETCVVLACSGAKRKFSTWT